MRPGSTHLQSERWIDWPIWLIQICILTLITLRLDATRWTPGLGLLVNLILYGYSLGTLAGIAKIKKKYAILIGFLYGILAVFFILGQIYQPEIRWSEGLSSLIFRLQNSIFTLRRGSQVEDPILFSALSATILWLFAYFSACQFGRSGNIWINLIGGGFLFLLIDRYDLYAQHRSLFYMAWMGLLLLLITRSNLKSQQHRWNLDQTRQDAHVAADLTRISWVVILGSLTMTWVLPVAVSPQGPIVKLWRSLTTPLENIQQQAANAFAPLENQSVVRTDFSNRYLALGLEANQESTPVLLIQSDQPVDPDHRFYWRARSYDTYQDGFWSNSEISSFPFTANLEPEILEFVTSRKPYHFSVRTEAEQLTEIYTEQQPSDIQLESRVYAKLLPGGKLDLNRLQPEIPLSLGTRYEFTSLKSTASMEELSQASSEYPDWIRATYLQMPLQLRQELSPLASEITFGATTPYEKTVRITRYLRDNFTYQPKLNPPSESGDPVKYFLFTSKQGFCTYFASAEVLLLRSAGIPARMVIGFSQGEEDENGEVFQVRMKDLHTWPEVFFAEYGWIAFEPTVLYDSVLLPKQANLADEEARQELLDRRNRDRESASETPAAGNSIENQDQSENVLPRQYAWLTPPFLISIITILILAGILYRRRLYRFSLEIPLWLEQSAQKTGRTVPAWISNLAIYSRSSEIRRAYLRVTLAFALLGGKYISADTARERHQKWIEIYPAIEADSKVLLNDYELDQFSPTHIPSERAVTTSQMMVVAIFKEKITRLLHRR